MRAKFGRSAAALFLASGILASSALVPANATSPKLAPGHYLFDALETAETTGNCPFGHNTLYQFTFVLSSAGSATMRLTPADLGGSKVVILTIPKRIGTGAWNVTYTAKVFNQSGTQVGTWTGNFNANGVPADTESIAISLSLTNWPNSVDATKCAPTFNASGAMTGTGS